MTQGDANKSKTEDMKASSDTAEDAYLKEGEKTIHEMRDAMVTMMESSTKMMQSFVDMRLSYLKVMRAGLDDPKTAFEIMSKNMQDVADAMKKDERKK